MPALPCKANGRLQEGRGPHKCGPLPSAPHAFFLSNAICSTSQAATRQTTEISPSICQEWVRFSTVASYIGPSRPACSHAIRLFRSVDAPSAPIPQRQTMMLEIVAAAPEETGALAILPAVFKAYETLTCQPLDPETKETAAAALREADALSGELDTSKLEELLGAMTDFFDELAALSDDELRERIRSIAAEHGMTLNDAQTQQLADLFRKIQSLGGSNFAERVQDLPETVEKIRESGENALSTAGTVWDSIRGFFRSVGKTLSAIFGG